MTIHHLIPDAESKTPKALCGAQPRAGEHGPLHAVNCPECLVWCSPKRVCHCLACAGAREAEHRRQRAARVAASVPSAPAHRTAG